MAAAATAFTIKDDYFRRQRADLLQERVTTQQQQLDICRTGPGRNYTPGSDGR